MATVEIAEGDTWDSIAASNGVDLDDLLAANARPMDPPPDLPDPGNTIFLPGDPPSIAVAPNATHNISVCEEVSFCVRLELPPDVANSTEAQLRLYSADGAHDQTIAIAGNFAIADDAISIVFHSLDPSGTYSLDCINSDGSIQNLIDNEAYSDLGRDFPDAFEEACASADASASS